MSDRFELVDAELTHVPYRNVAQLVGEEPADYSVDKAEDSISNSEKRAIETVKKALKSLLEKDALSDEEDIAAVIGSDEEQNEATGDSGVKDYMQKRRKISVAMKAAIAADDLNVNAGELYAGTLEEMEHTNDWRVAMKIALDHLKERPDYYERLKSAGLMNQSENGPESIVLRKSDGVTKVNVRELQADFVSAVSTVAKAGDRWKNTDGTFKKGFDGCVAWAMADVSAGGKGIPTEERARALCAVIGRRAGKI